MAKEVCDVVLPAGDMVAEVVQPDKKRLDLSEPPAATWRATVLGGLLAVPVVRRNQVVRVVA